MLDGSTRRPAKIDPIFVLTPTYCGADYGWTCVPHFPSVQIEATGHQSPPCVCCVCFVRKNRRRPRLGRMPPSHQVDTHNHGEREGKAADRDGKCFFLSQEKQFLTIMENTSSSGEIWKVLLETMWTNVGIKWDLSKTAYYVCLDIRISFM